MVEVRLVCPRKRCNRARMREGVLPQCPDCRGVWIPEAALHERIARRQQKPPQLAWRREARAVLGCLVCQAPMETLCLYDVPIDRCKGHGIWLDGGELEGVLDHCTRTRRANEVSTLDVVGDVAVVVAEVGVEGAIAVADVAVDAASFVGHAVSSAPAWGGTPGVPSTPGAAVSSGASAVSSGGTGASAVSSGGTGASAVSSGGTGASAVTSGGTGASAVTSGGTGASAVSSGGTGASSAGEIDVPAPTAAFGVGAGTGAMDAGDGADIAGGAIDVVDAATEGGGGALEAVGDALGTVGEGAVTVVGAVASGSAKVVTTIVEGLLDGLGSILDF